MTISSFSQVSSVIAWLEEAHPPADSSRKAHENSGPVILHDQNCYSSLDIRLLLAVYKILGSHILSSYLLKFPHCYLEMSDARLIGYFYSFSLRSRDFFFKLLNCNSFTRLRFFFFYTSLLKYNCLTIVC